MFYSTTKALANQKREFRNDITGAVIANSSYETGNDLERDAANAVAQTAIGVTITALVNGGYIKSKQLISQYTIESLRAAYARSIA